MPYDEGVAARLRSALGDATAYKTRKMFGGLAFMVDGNMCCGVIEHQVVLRLGKEGTTAALEDPHISEMDFTGRIIRSMVYLDGDVSDDALEEWVSEAVAFTASLPEK